MKSILQVVQNLIKPYIDKIAGTIAPVEVSPSEHAYTVGKQIIYNGVLYSVTSAIAVNDNLEVGVNIISASNIFAQMNNKQSTYAGDSTAWDTTPTTSSTKPVTSGGIKTAIDGKETAPTILTQTLTTGSTSLTFTDASIGNNSRISFKSNPFVAGLIKDAVQSGTTVTLTCKAQESNVSVMLEVRN